MSDEARSKSISRKIKAIEALVTAQAALATAQSSLAEAMHAVVQAMPDSIPPPSPPGGRSDTFTLAELLDFEPEPASPYRLSTRPTVHAMPAMTGAVFERSIRNLIKDEMSEPDKEKVRNMIAVGVEQRLVSDAVGETLRQELDSK